MEQIGLTIPDKSPVDEQVKELSRWWEIKLEDFVPLMENKAKANSLSFEAQIEAQYNLYQIELASKGETHATKFSLKEKSCN